MVMIEELTKALQIVEPILNKIANGTELSFDEAWALVTIYKRYRNIDTFVDYVEETQKSEYVKLRNNVATLAKETSAILHIYYGSKELFKSFDPKPIYKMHLQPSYSAYQDAQVQSVKAYEDFKPIQSSMDFPELHYTEEEIPHMWEIYNRKKEFSDMCSKCAKELFEVYDRERRRTAELFNFKLSAFVMLVYSLDSMAKALLADLNDIVGKEDNG